MREMTLSAECSASSTPDAVVLGPGGLNEGSPKKAPRLKALPKMEMSANLDITTLSQAQTVLSQLGELRQRVLRAFPEAGEANGGVHQVQRRSLQEPPLPGSVEDEGRPEHEPANVSEAQEQRIRAIVRDEMQRRHPDSTRLSRFGRTPSRSCSPSRTDKSHHHPTRSPSNYSPHAPVVTHAKPVKDYRAKAGADGGFEMKVKQGGKSKREKARPDTPSSRAGSDSHRSRHFESDSEGESTMAQQGSPDDCAQADDPHSDLPSPIRERPSQEGTRPQLLNGDTKGGEDQDLGGSEGGAKEGKEEGAGDDGESCEWAKVSENAFGAFIHVGLQSGLKSAVIKTGPMLILSLLIQFIFSEELIVQHAVALHSPHERIMEQICWVPVKLQISALLIFITLMFGNIPGMYTAARLALLSTHHKGGDGDEVGELGEEQENHDMDLEIKLEIPMWKRLVIFAAAVLSEILSWFAILAAGVLFAFTSPNVDLVIRSTVSVMFVLNIDEIVFEACCPLKVKDDVEETEYKIPTFQGNIFSKYPFLEHLVGHYYGVYVHLPVLAISSSAIIFTLRIAYLGCEVHPLWQEDHVKGLAPWPGNGLPPAAFPIA